MQHEKPLVSLSNVKYYLQQILPLFIKHEVVHFKKTDAWLANNGLPAYLQKIRCHVRFEISSNSLRRAVLWRSTCYTRWTSYEAEQLKQLRYVVEGERNSFGRAEVALFVPSHTRG